MGGIRIPFGKKIFSTCTCAFQEFDITVEIYDFPFSIINNFHYIEPLPLIEDTLSLKYLNDKLKVEVFRSIVLNSLNLLKSCHKAKTILKDLKFPYEYSQVN